MVLYIVHDPTEGNRMYVDGLMKIAVGDNPVYLIPAMANRHGLIAGATGTGKTVTLKTLAQSMSDAGIPTFLADIKGDVSGMAVPGAGGEKLTARLAAIGIHDYQYYGCPTHFWDVYGEGGIPVRTTITEMGPMLLARLLGLTEVQEGVLNIVFHVADDNGYLLLDLKDLREMVGYVGEHAKEFTTTYGQIATASIGAIQRGLLQLEDAGGDVFFGEPAIDIMDWMTTDADGKGYVNILDCVRLAQSPLLYSTFLLWMLSEIYERLPEEGDLAKPKMCFFFDEAHLLFDNAPKALLTKVEQVVKLIRSKGVGVYFITQNPSDIPDSILAQLGNRIQHALRAYTPAEQKAIKAAAQSFRVNPNFDTEQVMTELATGEALISVLDGDGKPTIVERAKVIAPSCSMDKAPDDAKEYITANDQYRSKYAVTIDRESAYEILNANAIAAAERAEAERIAAEEAKIRAQEEAAEAKRIAEEQKQAEREALAAQKQAEREAAAAQRQAEREAAAAQRQAEREAAAAQRLAEREALAAQKQAQAQKEAASKLANAALTSMSRSIGTGIARGILGLLKK